MFSSDCLNKNNLISYNYGPCTRSQTISFKRPTFFSPALLSRFLYDSFAYTKMGMPMVLINFTFDQRDVIISSSFVRAISGK